MARREPIAVGEWYHCFTRGVDKRVVFETDMDYERFLVHLYVANGTRNIRVSSLSDARLNFILADTLLERGEQLVEVGAYALMPTHAHLLLKEKREGGIATFMQKVFTGYTMYFNNKSERIGALFSGTFKSKHIYDDRYFKRVIPYILLNPIELFIPEWKQGATYPSDIQEKLLTYPYTSLPEFCGVERDQKKLVTASLAEYYDNRAPLSVLLKEAHAYYEDNPSAG